MESGLCGVCSRRSRSVYDDLCRDDSDGGANQFPRSPVVFAHNAGNEIKEQSPLTFVLDTCWVGRRVGSFFSTRQWFVCGRSWTDNPSIRVDSGTVCAAILEGSFQCGSVFSCLLFSTRSLDYSQSQSVRSVPAVVSGAW